MAKERTETGRQFDNFSFSGKVAEELKSSDLALIVRFLQRMIKRHKKDGSNFRDGKTWNYFTYGQLNGVFPWISTEALRRRINELVELKVLEKRVGVDRENMARMEVCFVDESRWILSGTKREFGASESPRVPSKPTEDSSESTRIYKDKLIRNNIKDKTINARTREAGLSFLFFKNRSEEDKNNLKGQQNLSDEQQKALLKMREWNTGASEDTLRDWAKNFSIERLSEVHAYSVKNSRTNIVGYMTSLLKKGCITSENDMVVKNRKHAQKILQSACLVNMKISDMYATITSDNGVAHEIPFSMQHEEFDRYLIEKLRAYGIMRNKSKQ